MKIKEDIDNLLSSSGIIKKNRTPAETVIQEVCKVKKGERVLIIANPATSEVAQNLYTAAEASGALPTLMYQPERSSFDNATPEVIAAIGANPDVCFSISSNKLGKDPSASANPYKTEDGQTFTHIFDYLLDGKKSMRAVWTPGITVDMMNRAANIDYKELASRCARLTELFKGAKYVHVTAPAGTDIEIPIENRSLLSDDGDFSRPGTGGNIPAGEVFISPLVGGLKKAGSDELNEEYGGVIVFDGSMTFPDGDSILETPIKCTVERSYVKEITGGDEAKRLLKGITEAESRSIQLEKEGKLPKGMGEIYKKNARNIGELGIGLNPAARITGNMLEDEKAFHTCHFAIGENYDNDAPSLIHLDGVVREPTITIKYADASKKDLTIVNNGILQI